MKLPSDSLPGGIREWVSLLILFLVNLLNYMDRYTLSAVLVDFSAEMCPNKAGGCSFTKQGLLQTALVVVYLLAAPLFGYLGDRYSRKLLVIIGIVLWASFSLASSFMPSYMPYLFVRAMLSIGESAFTVIAPTIIGDLFSAEKRSLAFGLFYIAIPFGTGLGFFAGGGPADWRWGLRITPIISFCFLIFVILFLYDPPRGASEGRHESNEHSFLSDLKYLLSIKSFVLNAAGFTCVTFVTGSMAYYATSYYEAGINTKSLAACNTSSGWVGPDYESPIPADDITFAFGMAVSMGGFFGVMLGMGMSVWLRPKFQWIDPVICGVSLVISLPILIGGVMIARNTILVSFIIVFIGMIFLNFNWSVAVDMTIYVVTPARRSSAEAIHLMLTHALGEAGAPFVVGFLIDAMEKQVKESHGEYCSDMVKFIAIQQSLFLPFAMLLLGGVLFLLATKWVRQDKLRAENSVD